MPLLIKRASAGLFRPRFYCDHCGQEIDDLNDGHYAFRMAILQGGQMENVLREGDATDLFCTHKRCQAAFEEANGGHGFWITEELAQLPDFLVGSRKPKRP